MIKYISVFLILLVASCSNEEKIPERDKIVSLPTLRDKYIITGFAVGDLPKSGEFYNLTQLVSSTGSKEQYDIMLKDPNPAVRVMGLVCLHKKGYSPSALHSDVAEIIAAPFGCGGFHMTVGDFSMKLNEDEVFRACFCENIETAGRIVADQSADKHGTNELHAP